MDNIPSLKNIFLNIPLILYPVFPTDQGPMCGAGVGGRGWGGRAVRHGGAAASAHEFSFYQNF